MPRQRKLKSARLVTLLLEEEIYEKARQLARAKGISFSELVRSLLVRELEQSGQLVADLGAAEIAELEEEVARLEERVSALKARGFRERGALKAEAIALIRALDEARRKAEGLPELERVNALKRRLNELRNMILRG
ncbi:MAG: DUF6364 family protein [Thermofilum sp.]|nr:DUF6364 family protein [Thermofilum sp.]